MLVSPFLPWVAVTNILPNAEICTSLMSLYTMFEYSNGVAGVIVFREMQLITTLTIVSLIIGGLTSFVKANYGGYVGLLGIFAFTSSLGIFGQGYLMQALSAKYVYISDASPTWGYYTASLAAIFVLVGHFMPKKLFS